MKSEKILELEIQLLIVKYGYKPVIKAIALQQNYTLENIEEKISVFKEEKIKRYKPKQINIEEIATRAASEAPHVSQQIRQLALKFDNKTFLPQLKDVRRFIEKKSTKPMALKNRLLGAKQVFNVLKELSKQELDELIEATTENQSDYSLLSDQIISKNSDSQYVKAQ